MKFGSGILGRMALRRLFTSVLISLTCALLLVRVVDTHLHLCFDGQEQSVSLHGADGRDHHEDEGPSHSDKDVDVAVDAVTKKHGGQDDLSFLVAAFFVLLSWPVQRAAKLESPGKVLFLPFPFDFRPPLRGPPR